ncbi:MAG: hypothetical protein LBG23_02240 [Endomicrobium sp.]|nr:hypothetical protein [Endomicrobium sp.]
MLIKNSGSFKSLIVSIFAFLNFFSTIGNVFSIIVSSFDLTILKESYLENPSIFFIMFWLLKVASYMFCNPFVVSSFKVLSLSKSWANPLYKI